MDYKYYLDLQNPIFEMMKHGVRFNVIKAKVELEKLTDQLLKLKEELAELCGHPLHTISSSMNPDFKAIQAQKKALQLAAKGDKSPEGKAKRAEVKVLMDCLKAMKAEGKHKVYEIGADLSGDKIKKFLYVERKLPPQRKRKKLTADVIALKKLRLKVAGLDLKVINKILEHRTAMKLTQYLDPSKVDEDWRLRCTYKLHGTQTGRLSSSKNPFGKGMNLQNITKAYRFLFEPDRPDMLFLKVDGSQIEGRLVYARSKDPTLIELARSQPHEFDMHSYMAGIIFGKNPKDVTKEERSASKVIVHLSNYDGLPPRMSDSLLTRGFEVSVADCARYQRAYLDKFAGVVKRMEAVRYEIMTTRKLTNSWGWEIRFDYEPFSPALFRRGFAWHPQSDAGILLSTRGLAPLSRFLRGKQSRLNLTVYDELVVSVTREEIWEIACFLKAQLEAPRVYDGVELSIPMDFSIGKTWKTDIEWKSFPSQEEMLYGFDQVIAN